MKISKLRIYLAVLIGSLLFTGKVYSMHISEGILPFKWALVWYLIALPFLVKGIFDIKKKSKETISFKPLLGMIGAAVFIISCMPIPVPIVGSCSHPAGTGIAAILIGPILSIFVTSIALLIQALFLAHGGLTTWGADIVSMGVAGSFFGYFVFWILRKFNVSLFISGFAAGLLADWATYTTTSLELALALQGSKPMLPLFTTILIAFIPTQLPLGILEGILTGGMIIFVAKRRPDILASLGVIKNKSQINSKFQVFKFQTKKILTILIMGLLVFGYKNSHSFAQDKWGGVDESVVEKVAQEHGRSAWTPFINTDKGDLLLFVFLLAGTVGGFVIGYNYQKLFGKEQEKKC